MNLKVEKYIEQVKRLPSTGKHIIGQFDNESIIVYQAFRPSIAEYAVKHQRFGGDDYNFGRMSWIKPNFLWMMYRCGWTQKDDMQKNVLAIRIKKSAFAEILKAAVHSTYDPAFYESPEQWKALLPVSDVRLQWDPDHDPYGKPIERKAIQLGLRREGLAKFCTEAIVSIEDVTDFVKEQHRHIEAKRLDELIVPEETVYTTTVKL